MPNEEVLGPRKTMFVLVIVVGCFAVLWPRILSPLMVGNSRDKLQHDRDAGCCEVMFEKDLAVLQLLNEVCSSAVQVDGKIFPYAAAECRKAVNDTCGLDIADFLKRSNNIGKTSKILIDTMKASNSSCLKEHFGVPIWNLSPHLAVNSWTLPDTVKQERSPFRGAGPHPALRERGRAIPAGPQPSAKSSHITLPPNVRVKNSPLEGYFQLEIKPPPIPGMRPPLGSPGGPVPAPKSSMGLVMPIYTLCIIVFFVYTISKLLFRRAQVPYEEVTPDPQFRRRVFRDDSRSSPDKFVVTAISGLVAEVQQQMEASYAQNQQTQDSQDNHARPYTNGTVIHNSGPVHIIASEYHEPKKETSSDAKKESSPEVAKDKEPVEPQKIEKEEDKEFQKVEKEEVGDTKGVTKEFSPEPKEPSSEPKKPSPEPEKASPEPEKASEDTESSPVKQSSPEPKESSPEPISKNLLEEEEVISEPEETHREELLIDLTKPIEVTKNGDVKHSVIEDFIKEEAKAQAEDEKTKELLEEAIGEDEEEEEEVDDEQEKSSVKVMCMETRAAAADGSTPPPPPAPLPPITTQARSHEAVDVKSIYLETEIPQQTRVLVADFAENTPHDARPTKHSPMVVSGKMTLSLIQDARDTPERDLESTVDDFTTASALTQNAEKEGSESEEEVEEEVEVEEIEEEIEEEDSDEELKQLMDKKGTE